MKKQEWQEILESEMILLRGKAVELGQDEMLNEFYSQEIERLESFAPSDDVGYKEEMSELFNSFQGYYKYEKQAHFSSLAMFENLELEG